ncbi:VCBS domain-containing protein [Limnohabitans sp. DM1]|uniref:VCBS domain-containing protein n=1 Tax=Limnohabitans sp. DM1 TaxID=1597955 RepID=UPI001E4C1BCE|nr:VCBS domain-containing protein [Limnohabitans sp. DM1]
MKNLTLIALAVSSFLTACGGGGGGTNNTPASISGTSTGSTAKGASNYVSGTLKVTDPDAGQAVFKTPSSFVGTYGTFTFNESTGAWTYLIDNAKAATQALSSTTVATDTLTVTSSDGTATQDIKVTINGSSTGGSGGGTALVTSVPAPVYPSTDPYAAEKVAVFNRLNDDRALCGFGRMTQNALLDKAAQAHADYLAINKLENSHYETLGTPGYVG